MISDQAASALEWAIRLSGLSTLIQALEMLALRASWSDQKGIWRWADLKSEFPAGIFEWLFPEKSFAILQWLRAVCALVLLLHATGPFTAPALWLALAGTLLTSMRWRGAFNGGSDSLSLVVLLGLAAATLPIGPQAARTQAALAYIGIQTLLSYWIAGWVKIAEPSWRHGSALQRFFKTPQYGVPPLIQRLVQTPGTGLILGWGVIAFELAAPLSLLTDQAAWLYLAFAMLFHLVNSAVLGLNRFAFAWVSAYPAVIFLARWINGP